MNKVVLFTFCAAFLNGYAVSASASVVNIGGYEFDATALADQVLSAHGRFCTEDWDCNKSGTSRAVERRVTDTSPGTYVFAAGGNAFLELGFRDNVAFNGEGHDLALFELGLPDLLSVGLDKHGERQIVPTFSTGSYAKGFSLNVGLLDLSDFGIAIGDSISSLIVGMGSVDPTIRTTPSLSMVAALHSTHPVVSEVPLPASAVFLLTGLGAFSLNRKKGFNKDC